MSLPSILANTQTPHQPFLVICDTPSLPSHALLQTLVRRNIAEYVEFACSWTNG